MHTLFSLSELHPRAGLPCGACVSRRGRAFFGQRACVDIRRESSAGMMTMGVTSAGKSRAGGRTDAHGGRGRLPVGADQTHTHPWGSAALQRHGHIRLRVPAALGRAQYVDEYTSTVLRVGEGWATRRVWRGYTSARTAAGRRTGGACLQSSRGPDYGAGRGCGRARRRPPRARNARAQGVLSRWLVVTCRPDTLSLVAAPPSDRRAAVRISLRGAFRVWRLAPRRTRAPRASWPRASWPRAPDADRCVKVCVSPEK